MKDLSSSLINLKEARRAPDMRPEAGRLGLALQSVEEASLAPVMEASEASERR